MADQASDQLPVAVKPGIFTSELWLSVFGAIVGPGGLLVFLVPHLSPNGLAAAMCSAVLAAGGVIFTYIKSRQAVKTQ